MKNLFSFLLICFGVALTSCGGSGSDSSNDDSGKAVISSNNNNNDKDSEPSGGEATDDEPKNLAEAMQQATKAMEDAGMGNKVEVINFRELQKHLPEKLAGMERTSKGGQTSGALGMNVSTAEAKYKTDDGAKVEITLTDAGGLGMGLLSMAAWSSAVIDKEDENGSERTSTLDGYKSFEKTRNRDNSCELSVIAEGRYIATGKCRECKMDDLKKAIRAMELKDLPKGETK